MRTKGAPESCYVNCPRRHVLHGGEAGGRARLLVALAMGAFWLSFGPRSVLGGHFEYLKMSMGAVDFTPEVAWFLLGAQGG